MACILLDKYCPKCQTTKNKSEFAKNKARYDGLQSYCKPCLLAAGSNYAKKNREKANERVRKYRAKNPDRVRTLDRLSRRKRKEEGRLKPKKRNKQLHSFTQQKRRAIKLQNGIFAISKKEMKKLYASPCFYCKDAGGTIDHIIPLRKGGRHSIGNIVPACKSCNSSKSDTFLIIWRNNKRKEALWRL